jgi:hypothetical protein
LKVIGNFGTVQCLLEPISFLRSWREKFTVSDAAKRRSVVQRKQSFMLGGSCVPMTLRQMVPLMSPAEGRALCSS